MQFKSELAAQAAVKPLAEFTSDEAPRSGRLDSQLASLELTDARGACAIIGGEKTPINLATLYRGIKTGRYPKPIRMGPNIRRWVVQELQDAIMHQIALRDAA